MAILFWLLWIFDLITCIILFLAGDFRRSFTGNNPMSWAPLLLLGCVIAGPVARFLFKRHTASLVWVAVPAVALLIWYLIDRSRGG